MLCCNSLYAMQDIASGRYFLKRLRVRKIGKCFILPDINVYTRFIGFDLIRKHFDKT